MVGTQKSYDSVSSRMDAPANRNGHIPIRTDGPGIMIRGATIPRANEALLCSGSADDVILLLKKDIVSKHAQAHIIARICDDVAGNGAGVPFTAPEKYAVAGALAKNPSFSDTGLHKKLIDRYMWNSDVMGKLVENPTFTDDKLIHTIVKAQTTDSNVIDAILMHKKIDEITENEIARSNAVTWGTCYYLSARPMHRSTMEILKSRVNQLNRTWLDHVQIKEGHSNMTIQRFDSENADISHVLPAA